MQSKKANIADLIKFSLSVFALLSLSSCSLSSDSGSEKMREGVAVVEPSSGERGQTPAQQNISAGLTKKESGTAASDRDSGILSVKSIMIAALQIGSAAGGSNVSSEEAVNIEDEFLSAFNQASTLEVKSYRSLLKSGEVTRQISEAEMLKFAAQSGFNSVMFLKLNNYQRRSGSAYGSNALASFGIGCRLVSVNAQKIIWESSFYQADSAKPLISFDDGKLADLRFKTVAELVNQGAGRLAAEFSDIRRQAFFKN